jgi:hypothetical protein
VFGNDLDPSNVVPSPWEGRYTPWLYGNTYGISTRMNSHDSQADISHDAPKRVGQTVVYVQNVSELVHPTCGSGFVVRSLRRGSEVTGRTAKGERSDRTNTEHSRLDGSVGFS